MDYPIQIEQWWVDEARRVGGIAGLHECLDSFVPDVGRLSDLFTVARAPGFGNYTEDERLLVAYGLFHFPQNFVRAGLLLDEWTSYRRLPAVSGNEPLRILDLGCGLGAASFSALAHLAAHAPERAVELHAVDRSAASLALLRRLFDSARELWAHASLRTVTGSLLDVRYADGQFDLIVVSFALNEAFDPADDLGRQAWIGSAVNRLKPDGTLLIIEPAGETTSPRLEQLRDWVAEKRLARILGPCLHDRPCPLLRYGGAWCHEVRRWRVPESVKYLNRKLQRTVHDVKCSFLMVGGPATDTPAAEADTFRMVAPMHKVPGRLLTTGCAGDGKLHEYEMFTRSLDRAAEKEFLQYERGDVVRHGASSVVGAAETIRVSDLQRLYHPEVSTRGEHT